MRDYRPIRHNERGNPAVSTLLTGTTCRVLVFHRRRRRTWRETIESPTTGRSGEQGCAVRRDSGSGYERSRRRVGPATSRRRRSWRTCSTHCGQSRSSDGANSRVSSDKSASVLIGLVTAGRHADSERSFVIGRLPVLAEDLKGPSLSRPSHRPLADLVTPRRFTRRLGPVARSRRAIRRTPGR